MQVSCDVQVRFFPPPEQLRRFFTSFYYTEITPSPGETVTDFVQPEWANLRFFSGALPRAEMRNGTCVTGTPFTATGPSCQAVRFEIGATRAWGIGLLPLGWAKFVRAEAAQVANLVTNGNEHPVFIPFSAIARSLFGPEKDVEGECARISSYFLARINEPVADEERIVAVHEALIDPEVVSVGALVERTGSTPRTIERICRRSFGFAPKLLLRRQRFMRSLTQFMADPSIRWSGAMDGSYYDQAQFVRDCKQFLGMTPSQYAALDKPVLAAVMRERTRTAGVAVQTLDHPWGSVRRP